MFLLRIPKSRPSGLPLPPPPVDPDEMVMDAPTYRDLEIFEADGTCLYDLFSGTQTIGGSRVLRARMKKPWNKPARIRAVQESLTHILEHRPAFNRIPSDVMVLEVEKYLGAGLPLVTSENRFEFLVGALEVRFGDFRPYAQMVGGVRRTSQVIRTLRALLAFPGLARGRGELGAFLAEMRTLIERPAFAMISSEERWTIPYWKVMQIDRMVRGQERETVERLIQLVYQVDALVALADGIKKYGLVMPELLEGPLRIEGEGLVNPFVRNAVPNPVRLDQQRRMLFLTGPNMAGKTTYLRSCGTALYLAHLGMAVPASSFHFTPCERMFSSINVTDNVRGGVSFFRAEALRVKAIAQAVTAGLRVIALMDEPFRGTNVKDAIDASRAILERFATREGNLFLVASHLIELGDEMKATGQVDCRHFEASESGGRLAFEYILRSGVSSQRLGMRVLREEGIFELLDPIAGEA